MLFFSSLEDDSVCREPGDGALSRVARMFCQHESSKNSSAGLSADPLCPGSFPGRAGQRRPAPGTRMQATPGNSTGLYERSDFRDWRANTAVCVVSELGKQGHFLSSSPWSQKTDIFSGPGGKPAGISRHGSVCGGLAGRPLQRRCGAGRGGELQPSGTPGTSAAAETWHLRRLCQAGFT